MVRKFSSGGDKLRDIVVTSETPQQTAQNAPTVPLEGEPTIERGTKEPAAQEPVSARRDGLIEQVVASIKRRDKTVSFNLRLPVRQIKRLDATRGDASRSQFISALLDAVLDK